MGSARAKGQPTGPMRDKAIARPSFEAMRNLAQGGVPAVTCNGRLMALPSGQASSQHDADDAEFQHPIRAADGQGAWV